MIECFGVIDKILTENGINYEFQRQNERKTYPYCVGSYQETGNSVESGLQELMFYLDCYTTGTWLELEQLKEQIKQLFMDYTTVTESGTGIAINYENSIPVPIDTADYKHIQINLTVKEWSVNE